MAEGLENSQLTVNGTIVMDNEERTVPIIWIEKDQGTVTGSGIEEYYATTETNNKEQTYYYSDEKYATTGIIESSDELLEALTNEDIDTVELTKDVVIETEEETLTLDKKITINGNGATIKSKLNITGNEVKIQDVKLNNTSNSYCENVVLDEVKMTGFDTGYSIQTFRSFFN
ncbi:MAG: pectate lyase-like adhesive domain-containing protein [Intestinibacter sp.]